MRSNVYHYQYWVWAIQDYGDKLAAYRRAQEEVVFFEAETLEANESSLMSCSKDDTSTLLSALSALREAEADLLTESAISNRYGNPNVSLRGNTGHRDETVALKRLGTGWVVEIESNDEWCNYSSFDCKTYLDARNKFDEYVSSDANELPCFWSSTIMRWRNVGTEACVKGELTELYAHYGLYAAVRYDIREVAPKLLGYHLI